MSNKTQLQTNNTALDALITRVSAAKDTAASLPEAGGSGGGGIETCTVQVGTSPYPSLCIGATILNDTGNISTYCTTNGSSDTIQNVICGSVIYVYDQAGKTTSATYGVKSLSNISSGQIYEITANPGETAIISVVTSGGGYE